MASIVLLVDTFPGPGISALWTNTFGASIAVVGGQLQLTTSTSVAQFYSLHSASLWDLTNSAFAIQLVSAGNQSLGSLETYPIYLDQGGTGTNSVYFLISVGTISCWQKVAGVTSNLSGATSYDPVAMQWLRIRETAGTIYWETAPDGLTWTVMFSVADPFTPITSMQAIIQTGTYHIESVASTMLVDNANATPTLQGRSSGHGFAGAIPGVIVSRQLVGASSGHSTVSGLVSVNALKSLAGRGFGGSTVSAALTTLVSFTKGRSLAASGVWAQIPVSLVGPVAGHASTLGRMVVSERFTGSIEGTATVRGVVHVTVLLRGPVSGHAGVRGRVLAIRQVRSTSSGTALARGTLLNVHNVHLVGFSRGSSSTRGRFHFVVRSPGRSLSTSLSVGRIAAVTGKLLNARSQGTSRVVGHLDVRGNPFRGWGTPIQA